MGEQVPGEEHFTEASAAELYRALARRVLALEGVEVRVSKSQVAFRAGRGFAYAWDPRRHLRSEVPLVVSIALPYELESERFKEVAHPAATTWMHHVELRRPADVDPELLGWVEQAWEQARRRTRGG